VISEGVAGGRFLDRGRSLAAYSDLIYVVCPRCGAQAVVIPRPGLPALRYYSELQFRPRRLVCPHCGSTRDWAAEQRGAALVGVALGGPNEPFFSRPLWLQTPCCGHTLWAYNSQHLDTLQFYLAAGLREHIGPTMGMLGRLPAWIKKASHRSELLQAIERLRDQLRHPAPGQRGAATYDRPEDPGPRSVRDFYFRPPY
jgi:hypothetical protein